MTEDPVRSAIVSARVQLLLNKPFFGQMAMRLDLVDATKWCGTAATDGRRLYYNRDFIKALKPSELEFLVCHEILHCIYSHMTRRGTRDPKIYNMACDYIVNWTIKSEKIGEMPKGGLYKDEYNDDLSSEELYDILIKNSATIEVPMDEHLDYSDVGSDDGDEDGDDGDEDGEGSGSADGEGGEDGEGKPGKKGKTVTARIMGEDGPPVLTQADINKIQDSLLQALQETAQSVGAGSVPKGVKRLINQLVAPRMDWRSLLDAHIRSTLKDDYTYSIPNRRNNSGSAFIFAGQDFLNTVKIAISIDTSGSMTDEMLRDFLSEVKGIMEEFKDFEIDLWTFDTQVYGHTKFTADNLDDIMYYEPKGGGGTMFECNWLFMRENEILPERFIMFTDGYPNSGWGEEDYVDTLFVIHGSDTIESPFGITAYYDDHKKMKKAA